VFSCQCSFLRKPLNPRPDLERYPPLTITLTLTFISWLWQVTHMPPELLSEGQMSKAADVYAVGVLLWEVRTPSSARALCAGGSPCVRAWDAAMFYNSMARVASD
jgi:hypothetical protein